MENLASLFKSVFDDSDGIKRFFCPGRVNLIGEHIDYQGGLVLPTAISLGITALCRLNDENFIRLHSTDFNETISFDLNNLPNEKQGRWSDYVLGVIHHLRNSGAELSGCDMLFDSSLPKASGLSSSAALEVLSYYSLYTLNVGGETDRKRMALDCQEVENRFIGVKCGIMDQFAVANGKADHSILLDCHSLKSELIPLDLGDFSLVIVNSNKPRTLAESGYNQRRRECERALDILRESKPELDNLVNAGPNDLGLLDDPVLKKRARHVITEQIRVTESAKVLKTNDLAAFGRLMSQSHRSLQRDYQVSCIELDFIVDFLNAQASCLGARMTGAGFGGCAVALVSSDSLNSIDNDLTHSYETRFGFALDFYACIPSDGVHSIA